MSALHWSGAVVLAIAFAAPTVSTSAGDHQPHDVFERNGIVVAQRPGAPARAPADDRDVTNWPAVSLVTPAAPSAQIPIVFAGWPVGCPALDVTYVDRETDSIEVWGTVELVQGAVDVEVTYPSVRGDYLLRASGTAPGCGPVFEQAFYVRERLFSVDDRRPVTDSQVAFQASGWPTGCTSLALTIGQAGDPGRPWAEVPLTGGSGAATATAPEVAGRYRYTITGVEPECGAEKSGELSVRDRALRIRELDRGPALSPTEMSVTVDGWPHECAGLAVSYSPSDVDPTPTLGGLGEIRLDRGSGEVVVSVSDEPDRYQLWVVGPMASCGDPAGRGFTIRPYVAAEWNHVDDSCEEAVCSTRSMLISVHGWPPACRGLDLRVTPIGEPVEESDTLTGRIGVTGARAELVEIPLAELGAGGSSSVEWTIEVSGDPSACGSAPPVVLESLSSFDAFVSSDPGSMSARFDDTSGEIVVDASGWYVECPFLRLIWGADDGAQTAMLGLTNGAGSIRVPAPGRRTVVFDVSWPGWPARCVGVELPLPGIELVAQALPPITTAPTSGAAAPTTAAATSDAGPTATPGQTLPSTGQPPGHLGVLSLLTVAAGTAMIVIARRRSGCSRNT